MQVVNSREAPNGAKTPVFLTILVPSVDFAGIVRAYEDARAVRDKPNRDHHLRQR